MKSVASIKGQPIHSMLMVIPAGAFALVLVFDLLYLFGAGEMWWLATEPLITAGLVGGVLAAIPGVIDLTTSVDSDRAVNVATGHVIAAFVLLIIFAINLMARMNTPPAEAQSAVWWSAIGFALLLTTAWLGGRLVYNHGVGIGEEVGKEKPSKATPESEPRRGEEVESPV